MGGSQKLRTMNGSVTASSDPPHVLDAKAASLCVCMVSRRFVVLASLTLFSLIAIAWISDHSARVMAGAVDSLDHTRTVLLEVDQLRAALAAAESNALGYGITRDPSFNSGLDRAAVSLRQSLTRLKTLAGNDEQQQASLAALDALIVRRLDLFRTQVQPRVRVARETVVTRKIAEALGDFRSEELGHFRDHASRMESARRVAIYGPWGMCLIAVIMFSSMLVHIGATLERAREIRSELQRSVQREHVAREGAEEADHMKDQFLATVSHELRTPLTSILGWCGLLSDEKLRQTLLDEGLVSIAQAARVQSQLVEDLLDASRIIAGKLEPRLADVNPVDVIGNAIASVAPSSRAKGITISKVVEEPSRTLHADATRLEQIVWNLLSNAIKFTPENGSICVALHWKASTVEISVADNGEGIAPDLLPYIFDRFRQGHASGTRKGGLGLGLSIVKSLVELHGGTVRAESAGTGAGATFIVELPAAGVGSSKQTPSAIGHLFIAQRHSMPGPAL